MKSYLSTLIIAWLVLGACSTSKKAVVNAFNPAGSWDYIINETPMGDVSGVLVLKKVENGWTGSLNSPQGALALSNISVADRNLNATFEFDGTPLQIDANFESDTMLKGNIVSEFGNFPLSANKQ